MANATGRLEDRPGRGGIVWRVSAGSLMLGQFAGAVALPFAYAHQEGDFGGYAVIFGLVLAGLAAGASLVPAIFVLRGGRSAMTAAIAVQAVFAALVAWQAAIGPPEVALFLPVFILTIALLFKARSVAPQAIASPAVASGVRRVAGQQATPRQIAL